MLSAQSIRCRYSPSTHCRKGCYDKNSNILGHCCMSWAGSYFLQWGERLYFSHLILSQRWVEAYTSKIWRKDDQLSLNDASQSVDEEQNNDPMTKALRRHGIPVLVLHTPPVSSAWRGKGKLCKTVQIEMTGSDQSPGTNLKLIQAQTT